MSVCNRSRLGLVAAAVLGLAAPRAYADDPAARGGFTYAAELRSAAFRTPGAPSVIVHAPPDFDARAPLHLVVYLHGYDGCIAVLMGRGPTRCKPGAPEREGWDLGRHHDAGRTNSLFVVPQLAYLARDGSPGAFAQPGGFRAFLDELLGQTLASRLGGRRTLRDVASLTLVVHSGAYRTALAIAQRGGVRARLRAVLLLDALYGETDGYARLVETQARHGFRFVSLHLARGTPHAESQRLARRLTRTLGPATVATGTGALEQAVASHPIVIGRGRPPHRRMPESHLAELLRGLRRVYLPPRMAAGAAD